MKFERRLRLANFNKFGMKDFLILETLPSKDYELIDSGEGEKLERYGSVVLSRPDPQALWPKSKSKETWDKRQARFVRSDKNARWEKKPSVPDE